MQLIYFALVSTFDTITRYLQLSGEKKRYADQLVADVDKRFNELQAERGIGTEEQIVQLDTSRFIRQLFLHGPQMNIAGNETVKVEIAKAMVLIELGEVSPALYPWIRAHGINGAMNHLLKPKLAFSHHIPSESITRILADLLKSYEPIRDIIARIPKSTQG